MKASPPRVAFQGEPGAFSEQAARQLLGDTIRVVPRPTFESLFRAIGERAADYALVPIENSLAGAVQRNYDLLRACKLVIVGETILPIEHCLIGCHGSALRKIRSVESHPVALAQCERFFVRHRRLRRIASDDTAASARAVITSRDPMRAAIASAFAAQLYGGRILRRHIEDHRQNFTRFLLLAPASSRVRPSASRTPVTSNRLRKPELDAALPFRLCCHPEPGRRSVANGGERPAVGVASGSNKCSLVFRLAHHPGTLAQAISAFAKRKINLVKIESRPLPGRPWEYCFYLDLQVPPSEYAGTYGKAHPRSAQQGLAAALRELSRCSRGLRILGRYPAIARHSPP